jgi:hypothetical protein
MVVRRPCRNPSRPHDTETDPAHPTPPRTSPRHHRGCPARSACHRPPPALSPHRQAYLDPTGLFPEADSLERDRARCPGHVDVNQSGRPACLERVCRSHASAPHPASLCARTCTASSPRRHATLALHRYAPKRPPRHTVLPPAALKLPVPRLNRPATDTACLPPGLSSRCRPSTPPTMPNRVRRRPP